MSRTGIVTELRITSSAGKGMTGCWIRNLMVGKCAIQKMNLPVQESDIEEERNRLYAPLYVDREKGIGWKELNQARFVQVKED